MHEFPNVDAEPLRDFLAAVNSRSRSLKRTFRKIIFDASNDEASEPPLEKLDVTFQKGITSNSVRIKLVIWADRWVWVDAREPSRQGWRWFRTFDGRLAGGQSGADLLRAIEEFAVSLPGNTDDLAIAERIWSKILLKGPTGPVRRTR
jgi:hypothetical protein